MFALDFDGVVCDTEPESSLSAWRGAVLLWPELFGTPQAEAVRDRSGEGSGGRPIPPLHAHTTQPQFHPPPSYPPPRQRHMRRLATCRSLGHAARAQQTDAVFALSPRCDPDTIRLPIAPSPQRVLGGLCRTRPVVETGFENLLLARLLLEDALGDSAGEGTMERKIMGGSWPLMAAVCITEWGVDEPGLAEFFAKVRDDWIATDFDGWLAPNRMYKGTAEAMRSTPFDYYVVTTKNARFASALLDRLGGVDVPADSDRMYGLGSGPKVDTLATIMAQPEHAGAQLHFVEDRLATLRKVAKDERLAAWNLYLVDWGYNTPEERAEAAAEGIAVINADQWGCLLATGAAA